jgi:hypothetical protein
MYGDLRGDTAADGRSRMLEYNRKRYGLAFPAPGPEIGTICCRATFQNHEPRMDGKSRQLWPVRQYGVASPNSIRGSENITLEVRDRRHPETIVSRETLVRNIDYSLDPVSGVLFMMRSVSQFDASLNIVQLVSTYEYESANIRLRRISVADPIRSAISGCALDFPRYRKTRKGPILRWRIGTRSEASEWRQLQSRVADERGSVSTIRGTSADLLKAQNGNAIRAEFNQPFGPRHTVLARNSPEPTRFSESIWRGCGPGTTVARSFCEYRRPGFRYAQFGISSGAESQRHGR